MPRPSQREEETDDRERGIGARRITGVRDERNMSCRAGREAVAVVHSFINPTRQCKIIYLRHFTNLADGGNRETRRRRRGEKRLLSDAY